jgi:hypothetical protein
MSRAVQSGIALAALLALRGLADGATIPERGVTNRLSVPLIFPVPPRSPVDAFRELLAMPRAERAQFLTSKSPETRKAILAKLREYESLKPDQRELRLKVTELRWYMLPLMRSSPTNREAQLKRLPDSQRDLVAPRLREWDALPEDVQKELLQNEATLQYFTEMDSTNAPPISDARRQRLDAGIAQWQALPEERRRDIVLRFNKFFELTPDEKARAITSVSEAERRQIEKTLKSFENLPPEKRAQCIQSFQKFASLSPEERQDFLKNAERWKLMSPEERQSWRELVSRLSWHPPSPSMRPPPNFAEQMRRRIKTPPPPHGATNRVATSPSPPQ